MSVGQRKLSGGQRKLSGGQRKLPSGQRKLSGGQRLGNTKLDEVKWVGKNDKCCYKIYNPGQKISSIQVFFFEVMMIIQIILRDLGKLNFLPLNG